MKPRDLLDLVALAAIWGGSFLLMRIAAPVFGPVPLIALRCTIAALFLVPILWLRGGFGPLRGRWGATFVLGAVNSAIPFSLFAFATLSLTAGLTSILNATAPLFGALVARVWMRERLERSRWVGLAIGFAGVVILTVGRTGFALSGSLLAILACLGATFLYGIGVNFTKRHFTGVPPLATSTGSLIAAAAFLVPVGGFVGPRATPGLTAWLAAAALGIVCTAIAYLRFFRLIESVGPTKAITVTYLIPIFGMTWGGIFLSERVTPTMLSGCAVVLLGTALATGALRRLRR